MNGPINHEVLRVPPQSIESEQALLGALLTHPESFDRIASLIRDADFYRYDHRLIFQNIVRLLDRSKAVDVITVFESLAASNKAEEVGGLQYLNDLAQSVASATNIARYADIVVDKARIRNMLSVSDQIAELAWDAGAGTSSERLLRAQAMIDGLIDPASQGDVITLQDALRDEIGKIDERYHSEGSGLSGVSSGFEDLDLKTGGMEPGQLILVAGRPSMGKSALGLNIAVHVAMQVGLPVFIWSGEMAASQQARRIISQVAGVLGGRLKSGKLEDADWPRLTNAIQRLQESQLAIDQRPGINIRDLCARVRAFKRKHGAIGLVLVDYLQLLSADGENRTQEVTTISKKLKELARELQTPVIALSQLNRALEQRVNKRPTMSDLRESGSLEQDADVVLFIYRDDAYHDSSPNPGTAEINIAKQREGETGTIHLDFDGALSKFSTPIAGWIPQRAVAKQARRRGFSEDTE